MILPGGRSAWVRYGAAVVVVQVALGLRLLAKPITGNESPFLLFLGAIVLAAWFGGLGPGVLATFLSAVEADLFLLVPSFHLLPLELSQSVRLSLFLLEGLLVSLLSAALHGSQLRAQASADRLKASEDRLRKLLEQARESEGRFRSMADSAPVLLWVAGPDGRRMFFNRSWLEFTGRALEQEIEGGWAAGVHPDDLPRLRDGYRSSVASGRGFQIEYRLRRADGEFRWLLETGEPRATNDGELTAYVGSAFDITETKLAEEQRTRLLDAERAARERAEGSERLVRFLADMIPQIVWTARPDGHLDYYNHRWFEYTGFSEEESFSAEGWKPALHPDDVELCVERWYAAVRTGEEYEVEYRFRRASDGTYRWHLGRAVPLRDASGAIVKWFGTSTDIDDQKRAQERSRFLSEAAATLGSSLEYETTLADVARLAISDIADWCVVDLVEEGQVRRLAVAHADPAKVTLVWELQRRFPTPLDVPYGPPHVVRTGEPELVTDVSDAILREHAREGEHLEILRALGFASYLCVPLAARGRVLGALTLGKAESRRRFDRDDLELAQDVARRAALAVDNALLYRQAQEANQTKDEFLATLSHELRTPLTAMLGWAKLLRGGRLDAETAARALESIERNTKAQAQMIEELLDVSRILSGKLRLNVRPLDPASVLEAAVEVVRPAAEAKGIEIGTSFERGVGLVLVDPDRMQQVLWNLLSNAIKFTPRGGRVEVALEPCDSRAEIRVSDTGRGIDPRFLPHVFDRFRQADSSSTRAHGGLGLGLAIVRDVVELHGGSVRAESEGESRGSTFVVTLPLQAVVPHAVETGDGAPEEVAGPAATWADLTGARVLLVDDEPDARELLAAVLARQGARVTPAPSTEAALRALGESGFDVLVSDIGMPGEDGYALVRRVRGLEREGRPPLPALALTAYAREEDRAQALREGFDEHLAKPVEPDELCAAVARLAAGARVPR